MSGKLVLVVDDDPDFVDAVQAVVEKGGYRVEVAYDGKEAMEKVAQAKPDCIILDVMMPVMNGIETAKALKADAATREIPIILLTAVAERVPSSKYSHRDVLETEAEDYIAKPVEPAVLLDRIKSWL